MLALLAMRPLIRNKLLFLVCLVFVGYNKNGYNKNRNILIWKKCSHTRPYKIAYSINHFHVNKKSLLCETVDERQVWLLVALAIFQPYDRLKWLFCFVPILDIPGFIVAFPKIQYNGTGLQCRNVKSRPTVNASGDYVSAICQPDEFVTGCSAVVS